MPNLNARLVERAEHRHKGLLAGPKLPAVALTALSAADFLACRTVCQSKGTRNDGRPALTVP
jgi:hypothetical protein